MSKTSGERKLCCHREEFTRIIAEVCGKRRLHREKRDTGATGKKLGGRTLTGKGPPFKSTDD